VIRPQGTGTSATYQPANAPTNNAPAGPSINQPVNTK
jgi:hypothetical protein